jgi:hypothetical protein
MATKPKKKTIRNIPQERTPMPEQEPLVRARNFEEVALGYRVEEALVEAERCLQCADEPCVRGCPVGIDIPGFIRKITEKHHHGAYDIITDTNLLPSVCGRVCPQESQCEGVCTVGQPDTKLEPVAIGRLERFVGDMAIREGWANVPHIEPNGLRVGIVGAGPAGLACAADMAKAGCEVVVYEALHQPGGVLNRAGHTEAASDLALLTVRLGQTTFPELSASIGRVTPMAKELGVSQEQLFATMATASGVTGGAVEVSTQLRSALKSLMAPTKGMSDLMKGLGYDNGQAMIAGLGLDGAMQAIVKGAKGAGVPLQTFMADVEGQTLALSLAGPLADDYTAKLKAMGDAAGTTDAAFKEQTKGVNATGFGFKQLKAQGKPIPTNDIWIAASAMQHGLQLVTFDRHFEAIRGLLVLSKADV